MKELNIIKEQEIKFIDIIDDIDKFIKIAAFNKRSDQKQEGPPINFQVLFSQSNEYLAILNNIHLELKKISISNEFVSLINPIQMKVNYYLEILYTINNKFINSLQKGNEENDQLCLEYIAESEKLTNDTYYLINNSFNEQIMKAIERSHVENENIFKESKKILGLLMNLRGILENMCSEEYVCSLVLKKKVEIKFASIQALIINIEGLLLGISNCSFFNISQINIMMQIGVSINFDRTLNVKRNNKLKKILNHIKDVEGFLNEKEKDLIEKVNKVIKERVNIEIKFYNYFLFMDEYNFKVSKIFETVQENGFNIGLFDNIYLEKINELCHVFEEINKNSQELLSLQFKEPVVLKNIQDNIKSWKENIENFLFLDEKSLPTLKNKIKFINELNIQKNSILRNINGILTLSEKSPRKKKKDSEKESFIENFIVEVNNFAELHSEANVAQNYVLKYIKKVRIKV